MLHALDGEGSLDIAPYHVHFGTAGGAVSNRDFKTRTYSDTTLLDLYDVTCLIDTLPQIHWCYRPLIDRDISTTMDLDINVVYALITGTSKPCAITLSSAEAVDVVTEMFDMAPGCAMPR
jgi:trimethylamine--corrinoid protein Co-methyltransferase